MYIQAERQSCKLKVMGSIPSVSFSVPLLPSWLSSALRSLGFYYFFCLLLLCCFPLLWSFLLFLPFLLFSAPLLCSFPLFFCSALFLCSAPFLCSQAHVDQYGLKKAFSSCRDFEEQKRFYQISAHESYLSESTDLSKCHGQQAGIKKAAAAERSFQLVKKGIGRC